MTLEPPSLLSEEKMMVYQYFTLLGNGKVDAILDIFIEEEDMAIVYEPFSKEQGLHGKDAIKNFLQVAAMANRGVEKTIEIIQPEVKKVAKAKGEECSTITITALVTFIR